MDDNINNADVQADKETAITEDINNSNLNEPVEITELFVQKYKTVTLLDTIVVQAIICVVIAIGYLVLNMFCSDVSVEIYDTFNKQVSVENSTSTFSKAVQSFVEFINSTPEKKHD